MFSLALFVSIIFLWILFSGPFCFVISGCSFIPTWFVVLFSIITIFSGLWFFLLPIPAVRYVGILSLLLGVLSINNRIRK
jgi:hypothetical protein